MRPNLVVMALAFILGFFKGTITHNSAKYNKQVGRNDIVKYEDDRDSLTRLNPWLSACDLAINRKTPDLQVKNICNIQF